MAVVFAFQEGLFPYENEDTLYVQLKDWGFDAVEVRGEKLEERVGRVQSASRTAGLPICGICPGGEGIRGSLLSDDAQSRALANNDIKILLQCAADLGGAGLNLVPEFGIEKFMALSPDTSDYLNRKQRFLDELGPVAERARDLGVTILLEPLNRYEAYFLLTIDQAADICRSLGNPSVRVLADLFHANIEDADVCASLARNISHIAYIHLADSNRLAPGLGHTNFGAVFDILRKADYSGVLSMECGINGAPERIVPRSLQFVRGLWAEKQY